MKPPAFDAASATQPAEPEPSSRRADQDSSSRIAGASPPAGKAGRPPRRQLLQRLCVLASAVLLLALSAVTAISALHRVESPPPAPPRPPPAAAEILGGTVVDPKYKYRFMVRLYTVFGPNHATTCGG